MRIPTHAFAAAALFAVIGAVGCQTEAPVLKKDNADTYIAGNERIKGYYDRWSGKLKRLEYDSNKNGKPDMFSYMDGTRVIRVEIDQNEDGRIDRWEYYGQDGKLEKVGTSRADNGKPDTWTYPDARGQVARRELSSQPDGKVTRTEFYEHGALVRAEEDTNGDGAVDKWEWYQNGGLYMLAFDSRHRGSPDRRIVYEADGSARVETDPDGKSNFRPAKK
jgi:antitoxin component YwqK of YwqJK toxin-antitoxin module